MRLATIASLGAAIVQWDDPFEFTPDGTVGPSVGRFQVWVYNTVDETRPEMTFEYGALGALPGTATIGTENILGDLATSLLDASDPSTLLEEGGSICLDYEGPSFETITLGYDVTVDVGAASGTYTNEAVHVTDDPYAEPVTASASVEVEGVVECTRLITGFHFGQLKVTSGVTCLDDATVIGSVNVQADAGLRSDASRIFGSVKANGASEISLCDTRVVGPVTLSGGSMVVVGDPTVDCTPNLMVGPVRVNDTAGPSVIAGNTIVGRLACANNDPAPVNKGFLNNVIGPKVGQCENL
jgi:hypothetical protein